MSACARACVRARKRVRHTGRDGGVSNDFGSYSDRKYVRAVFDGGPVEVDELLGLDGRLDGFRQLPVGRTFAVQAGRVQGAQTWES